MSIAAIAATSLAANLLGKVASAAAGSLKAAPVKAVSATDEFMKFATMTPAERMRASILSSMGLDEDAVKAMSAEDRKALENKIEALVKQQVEARGDKTPGRFADIKV